MKKILISIFIILNFVTYSESKRELDISKMNFKNRLVYAENEKIPFTGTFVSYYENNQLGMRANYKDGKLDGERILFYTNGKIKSKNYYTEGQREKEHTFYDDNGKITLLINYKNGLKDGETIYYDENNKVKDKFNYKYGKLTDNFSIKQDLVEDKIKTYNDNIHQVVKGDTLYNISKRYYTTPNNLKKINNLKSNKIKLGQHLKIYSYDSTKISKDNKIHIVSKGDTLYNISKKYNVSLKKLKEINNLKNDKIELKQKLQIPS
jgi:LysM repeat protein